MRRCFKDLSTASTYEMVSLNVSFYYAVDDDQDKGHEVAPED